MPRPIGPKDLPRKDQGQITKYVLFALYDDLNKAIYGYDLDRKVMFFSFDSLGRGGKWLNLIVSKQGQFA